MVDEEPIRVSEHYECYESKDVFIDTRTGDRLANTYQTKVEVFADRVRTWFLGIAREIAQLPQMPGDYVALSVVLAHIESIEQYRRGSESKSKSRSWFSASAKRLLGDPSDDVVKRLWEEARNGLFHNGFTEGRVYLCHDRPVPLEINGDHLLIDVRKLLRIVEDDFDSYIAELESNEAGELGRNFEKPWDKRWEES